MLTRISAVAYAFLLASSVCHAAPLGDEYLVNGYTPGVQHLLGQTTGANGDTAILFNDRTRGNLGLLKRYDYAGNSFSPEEYYYGANAKAVAVDGSGNFGILRDAPDGSENGGFLAVYNRNGSLRVPEFRIHANTANNQAATHLAFNSQGVMAASWQSSNGNGGFQYYVRAFNANGTALTAELPLPDLPMGLTVDTAGNITSTGFSCVAARCNIWMKKFNTYGTQIAYVYPLNTVYAGKNDVSPTLATNSAGNSVIVWDRYDNAIQRWTTVGRRVNSAGGLVGGEFSVTAMQGQGQQFTPNVAMRADGRFVVTWGVRAVGAPQYSGVTIHARAFNADATPVGSEFIVGPAATGLAGFSLVSIDPATAYDNLTISWTLTPSAADSNVYARRFTIGIQ